VNAADLLGWTDRVGSLEAGKWADVIAVDEDPLSDVTALEHVTFVTKGCVAYRSPAAHIPEATERPQSQQDGAVRSLSAPSLLARARVGASRE
jgi:hypothetical protein